MFSMSLSVRTYVHANKIVALFFANYMNHTFLSSASYLQVSTTSLFIIYVLMEKDKLRNSTRKMEFNWTTSRFRLLIGLIGFGLLQSASVKASCPSSKSQCDVSQTCNWSEIGTCVSSIACVLEVNQAACQSNTWGCTWTTSNRCERNNKISNSANGCSFPTSAACSAVKTCYWSATQNICTRRPTIILSVSDDLGWYDIGYHNPRARTPNLDRLKATGVNLEWYYSARFCSPTRAMLLTGRYPWRLGLQTDANLNPAESLRCATALDTQLLPSILKELGGYTTHAFGKWHLGSYSDSATPVHRGFDTFVGYYGGGLDAIPSVNSTDNYWVDLCACQTKSPSIPRGACNEYMAHPRIVCHLAMDIVNQTATSGIQVINSTNIKQESIDLFFANQVEQVILNTPFTDPLFLYLAWNTPHFPGKETTILQLPTISANSLPL